MKTFQSFLRHIEGLKRVRRARSSGGRHDFESIADHCFMMAFLAWTFGSLKGGEINMERLIKLELAHDLAKVALGEAGPHARLFARGRKRAGDLVSRWPEMTLEERRKVFRERHAHERKRVRAIISGLPKRMRDEVWGLWREYEECSSPEGRFAVQLGALENLLQALEYKREHPSYDTEKWWVHAHKLIDDPLLLKALRSLGDEKTGIRDKKG